MPPGGWWAHASVSSPNILKTSKFAMIELQVLASDRGNGIGRRLYDGLFRGRDERYATLAAVLEAPVYSVYLRWGWRPAGKITSEPAYSEAMILTLSH
jgi:hypothetical protein